MGRTDAMRLPGWSWLLVAVVSMIWTPAHVAPLPQTCDMIGPFAIVERYAFDDAHREALALKSDTSSERASRAEALWPRLQASLRRAREAVGARSAAFAILEADALEVAAIVDGNRYREEATRAADRAFEILSTSASTAAEADYLVDLAARKPLAARFDAIRTHRRIVGHTLRQLSALNDAIPAFDAPTEEFIEVGRYMGQLADALGNDRGRYTADGLILKALVEAGRQREAPELARSLLPAAEARLRHSLANVGVFAPTSSIRCWADDRIMRSVNDVLKGDWTREQLEANYILEAIEVVLFGELETDFFGASIAYVELLALKAIDATEYRGLMRMFGQINPSSHASSQDESGIALSGAEIFESLLYPALARDLYRDAKLFSASADARDRFEVLSKSLRFEWRSGQSTLPAGELDEARSLMAQSGDKLDAGSRLAFAILEAELAESRLEDRVAAEALARAMNIALAEMENPFSASNSAEPSGSRISTLLIDHLGGRWCNGCEAQLAEPLARWWRAAVVFDRKNEAYGSADDLTFHLAYSPGVAPRLADEARHEVQRLASQTAEEVSTDLAAKRMLDRLKPDVRTETLLAYRFLPLSGGIYDGSTSILEMIREKDISTKRELLAPVVAALADHASQFGADIGVFTDLETYARKLTAMNYSLAARLVYEAIVRLSGAEHGIDQWTTPRPAARLQLSRILAPAHAQLARYALEDKNWVQANAQLDAAMDLMTARLAQEWRAGSEQASLLYRAFRPALRLTAQLRFFLADNPDAAAVLPGVRARAFADFQLAMLGETALATQASIRRRIVADDALREAVEKRDRALDTIAELDAIEELVPSKLPWVIDARRKSATLLVEESRAYIEGNLRVSEDYAALEPVDLEAAAEALAQNEALAILHSGSNLLFGMIVRPGQDPFLFRTKVSASELADQVSRLHAGSSGFGSVDLGTARRIFNATLGPAESALSGVEHLIVVADGPLLGIPWPMLVTGEGTVDLGSAAGETARRGVKPIERGSPTSTGKDWSRQPWLIRRYPVSVSPSVRSLIAQRSDFSLSLASRPFLGVGDPLLAGRRKAETLQLASVFRNGGIDTDTLAELEPLPETSAELVALSGSLGASPDDLLLGASATETRLMARRLSDYRVLAFATHGILAGEVSGATEPGLVLSPEKGGAPGREGYLSLSEIMSLRLDADLVILSACNTGGADGRPRADWMSGLARGFIAAGARQLLVTLWSIPSEPTTRLTTGMAAAYKAEPSLGWPGALRQSILAMLDADDAANAHPASWAGFTMLGVGPRGNTN